MAPGRQPRQQLRDPLFGDYQQPYHAGSCKTYGAKVSTVSAGVEVGRQLSNNNKQTVSVSTRGLGSPRLHEEIGRVTPRRLGSFCFNKHMVSGSPRRLEVAQLKSKLRSHRDGPCARDSYHCEMHSAGRPGFLSIVLLWKKMFLSVGHFPMLGHRFLRRAQFFPMRREAQAARSVWGENLWFEAINIVFGRIKGHRRCSGSNGGR